MKTQTVNWDPNIETPGAPETVITGVAASKEAPATEKEWTEEELKSAKPLMVYFYVEGMDAKNGADDPSFKFSQSLELGGFGSKVIEELNANWRCKKVGIDLDLNRKDPKNQARIEFWSSLETKLGDITLKETGLINPGPLRATLRNMRAKNTELCAKELKRIQTAKKAADAAAKETAAK